MIRFSNRTRRNRKLTKLSTIQTPIIAPHVLIDLQQQSVSIPPSQPALIPGIGLNSRIRLTKRHDLRLSLSNSPQEISPATQIRSVPLDKWHVTWLLEPEDCATDGPGGAFEVVVLGER